VDVLVVGAHVVGQPGNRHCVGWSEEEEEEEDEKMDKDRPSFDLTG